MEGNRKEILMGRGQQRKRGAWERVAVRDGARKSSCSESGRCRSAPVHARIPGRPVAHWRGLRRLRHGGHSRGRPCSPAGGSGTRRCRGGDGRGGHGARRGGHRGAVPGHVSKMATYLTGELTATSEDYKLLENMNKLTSLKYLEMKDIAVNISRNLKDLNQKYAALQPHLDQITLIEEQVAALEQAAYKLDAYSKKLEAKYKKLERR
uniref:Biogenesis of lysosome-related organelles complex 1 subunit 2 n=1 Tax=Phascolarctos cinereus TaxID=38626 RepID=A0A6P5L0B3_PHACI|nr:biogenesis of lysosome-related organelles complex 1 subunit 2 [Phascolarctos cinereus]